MSLETPGQILHFALYRAAEVICGVVAVTFTELLFNRKNSSLDFKNGSAKSADQKFAPTIDRPAAIRLATIAGVTAMLIPILWSWLNLPSLSQIVVTSLVVLDRDGASTHFRGLQRVLVCLAGGAGGLLTVRLGPDSFFIWSVMLIAGVFLFSLIHHSTSRWAYVGTQGGVAFILALVTGIGPPGLDHAGGEPNCRDALWGRDSPLRLLCIRARARKSFADSERHQACGLGDPSRGWVDPKRAAD